MLPVVFFGLVWPWSPWKLTVNLKEQQRSAPTVSAASEPIRLHTRYSQRTTHNKHLLRLP